MASEALISQNQLKKWASCGQLNTLEQWLKDNGIRYFKNRKGEIVTTVAACDAALLGQRHEEIDF